MELTKFSFEVLNTLLSEIDEGIHVVDKEGKTVFYNEVAARHDGLKKEEVIGKPLLTVFPSLSEETSTLLKTIATGKEIIHQVQSYTNIHGKKIETINTTLPIFIEGELVGAMEIAKDFSTIKRLSETLVDLQRILHLKKNSQKKKKTVTYTLNDFFTKNETLRKTIKEAEKLAQSHSPILIFGESGTGKEVFVQGIHHASHRSSFPFIAQNCAAIPENLLESILFGTSKGSYTGAIERPGLFELAHGGTLFLDEIHTMPLDLQAKLLRVLEDGYIRRVGSTKNINIDVRMIVAMNVHPQTALDNKLIRPDLFYRINVLSFELIPLRERKEDIPYLTDIFIQQFNHQFGKKVSKIDEEVEQIFSTYSWPGNVRELKHTIEYMMNVVTEDRLTVDHLPIMLKEFTKKKGVIPSIKNHRSFREQVEIFERQLILQALEQSTGNINQAAKILQLPRQTLQYKIKKYQL